ncbi:MAG: hypothetical protein KDA80_06375 [Planctomycetaceae bacterium]|nr:hypothetical protein [Planctomycetaceae bacterium]
MEPQPIPTRVTLKTIAQFLIGQRQAIEAIADCRSCLWLGMTLTILAGLCREYDQEDLLREPWYLLIPLVASSVVILLLFAVIHALPEVRRNKRNRWEQLRQLASCFWMMSPMAALYAVPVERILDAVPAMATNLWFLAIVATWRVLLIIRVVSVIYGVSVWKVVFPVFLLADSVVLQLLVITPAPVFTIMGGLGLSERDQVVAEVRCFVGVWGTLTWPLWLIGTIFVIFWRRNVDSFPMEQTPTKMQASALSGSVWGAVSLAFLAMLLACVWTQPEQQRVNHYLRLANADKYDDALAYVNQFEPEDFPPHWEPRPWVGYGERQPDPMLLIEAALNAEPSKPWARELFTKKLRQLIGEDFYASGFWRRMKNFELEILIQLMESDDEWARIFREKELHNTPPVEWVESLLMNDWESSHLAERDPEQLLRLLNAVYGDQRSFQLDEVRLKLQERIHLPEEGSLQESSDADEGA